MGKAFIVAFWALGCMSAPAHAGDPCPITLNISDLGSPDWLDNLALINALESRQIWVGISFNSTAEGLALTRVYKGSPAENAGLIAGDVVMSIAGRNALDDEAFARLNIGETVAVSILRGGEAHTVPLTVRGVDPVPLAIVQHLHEADCRAPALAPPTAEMRDAVMAQLFTESRAFRCEDAHLALESLGERFESTTVYFVRGSRRILLTMPYFGTTCISTTALDGETLNAKTIGAVLEPVIQDYAS